MFKFISKMFGSEKAGEALVDGISSSIDKIWYTDEEKADAVAVARTEGFAVYTEWLKSTSGSRLARRFLAIIVTGPWAFAHTLSMLLDALAPFISGTEEIAELVHGEVTMMTVMTSDKYIAAANSLSANASENNSLVGVVLMFYFGGPVAGDAIGKMVTKWVDKKKNGGNSEQLQ